jgi:ribonuclease HI
MNSISKFITDEYLIEKTALTRNIWKKTHLDLEIDRETNTRENHLKKAKHIVKSSNLAMFYTNAAHDSKTKISTASSLLYYNSRIAFKTWNLEIEMSIDDAELYAIEKSVKWSKTLQNIEQVWIFTNNQNAIQCIEIFTHFLTNEIYETTENLIDIQTHIHWILEHANISENEKADQLTKSVFLSNIIARDRFLLFKYLNSQIIEHNHQKWLHTWKNNSKKSKHHEKFETISEDSKIRLMSKKFIKHVSSTISQLKLEHEYFKSYLVRLSNYETKKCNENCNFIQNSKHLLLNYHHFINERSQLINEMKSQIITLKTLFEIKKDIENLEKFLINTEIVTRNWILKNLEEDEEDE